MQITPTYFGIYTNYINIFHIELCYLIYYEFKSINFNKQATKLCVSSDHGTIHVFVLDLPEKNSRSS